MTRNGTKEKTNFSLRCQKSRIANILSLTNQLLGRKKISETKTSFFAKMIQM